LSSERLYRLRETIWTGNEELQVCHLGFLTLAVKYSQEKEKFIWQMSDSFEVLNTGYADDIAGGKKLAKQAFEELMQVHFLELAQIKAVYKD